MNILTMRRVKVKKGDFMLTEKINVIFDREKSNPKKKQPHLGNSAKADIPKKTQWTKNICNTYCTRLAESFVPMPFYTVVI
ncbi:MAG: hypothetical protein KBONHNOK_01257 [Candidatus Methanoperedenaceae archaeon GB50]|nr:MAG: hypothetical protein KBONHNOK_01257 [Candidatus Methanoperedenaceae archaeon GB50]